MFFSPQQEKEGIYEGLQGKDRKKCLLIKRGEATKRNKKIELSHQSGNLMGDAVRGTRKMAGKNSEKR